MQWRTFIIGWILALAVLLFAQRRPAESGQLAFRQVVALTHKAALNVSGDHLESFAFSTRMDAPIHEESGRWVAEAVPANRLVAPLVVLDVRDRVAQDRGYEVGLEDIARWEGEHGHVPPGAVVLARTGWEMPKVMPSKPAQHAAFSKDAVEFLVRARMVYGVGSDAPSIDEANSTEMPIRRYLGANHVYALANATNLDEAPISGGVLVVAPTMIQNAAGAPAKLLVLVR